MTSLNYVEAAAAALGLLLLAAAAFSRPFGRATWHFAFFAGAMTAASALLAFSGASDSSASDRACLWSFRALVAAAAGAFGFASQLDGSRSRVRVAVTAVVYGCAVALGAWVSEQELADDAARVPEDHVVIGLPGYVAALYLLIVSVAVLVRLEQVLRRVEEHVRWEIKFVVLGTYATFATLIYVASRILLRSPEWCYVPKPGLRVIPVVFGASVLLMLAFWRRLPRQGNLAVSQQVAYGSLTFFGVAVYLVGVSFAAQWAGTRFRGGVELGMVIFIMSSLCLTLVLSSARVRHRARYWMRRHFFAGRYDYRSYWLEALEKVRSHQPPEALAGALADIVIKAVGALDIVVWLRKSGSGVLRRYAQRGNTGAAIAVEASAAADCLRALKDPIFVEDLSPETAGLLSGSGLVHTSTKVVVPLRSGDETIGLLTVGHDKSGRTFDREVLEILRAIGAHVASEFHKMELLAAQVEAKEAETFQSFAVFVMHDLKNFASTLSLIAKNAGRHQNNPVFQRDAFESVLETAEKMKRICNSLHTFTGPPAARRAPHQLNDVVREATRSFQGSLGDRLRFDLESLPPVDIDGEEIARVVQNLVLNATEAISPAGTIRIFTRERGGRVELSVQDDGEGISPEFLQRELFQPFKTTKSAGLGIGLYQSKKIIEAHGGTISVESTKGFGTMVAVKLPAIAMHATENSGDGA